MRLLSHPLLCGSLSIQFSMTEAGLALLYYKSSYTLHHHQFAVTFRFGQLAGRCFYFEPLTPSTSFFGHFADLADSRNPRRRGTQPPVFIPPSEEAAFYPESYGCQRDSAGGRKILLTSLAGRPYSMEEGLEGEHARGRSRHRQIARDRR